MLIFIILIAAVCTVGMGVQKGYAKDGYLNYYSNALDNGGGQPTCIKGIFALVIFLQHDRTYVVLKDNFVNNSFTMIFDIIGQLMVMMFLFYSGYGIIKSYVKKPNYFKSYPRTRILKTVVHFELAMLLYILLNLALGIKYGAKQILLSLIAWDSIGNSNWFIFCIVILYLAIYLCQFKFKTIKSLSFAVLICSFIYMLIVGIFKEWYWINTAFTLPLGMLYAVYQDKLESFFLKNKRNYFIFLFLTLISWVFFPLFIVALTYRVRIVNKFLYFLGVQSFSIYILQRLPMILLSKTNLVYYPLTFTICTFVLTIAIAVLFTAFTNIVDKLLFSKRASKTSKSRT